MTTLKVLRRGLANGGLYTRRRENNCFHTSRVHCCYHTNYWLCNWYGNRMVNMGIINTEKLDEKGVVFLDMAKRPYWIRLWGGEPWLCYWHRENHWVSLRKITNVDVFPDNLPLEYQNVYHLMHLEWCKQQDPSLLTT